MHAGDICMHCRPGALTTPLWVEDHFFERILPSSSACRVTVQHHMSTWLLNKCARMQVDTRVRMLPAGAGSDAKHGPRAVGGRAGARGASQPCERCLPPRRRRVWRQIQPCLPGRCGRRCCRSQAETPGGPFQGQFLPRKTLPHEG